MLAVLYPIEKKLRFLCLHNFFFTFTPCRSYFCPGLPGNNVLSACAGIEKQVFLCHNDIAWFLFFDVTTWCMKDWIVSTHVRLQYHCSIFAAYLQSVLHVHWTDLQCMYFVLKYPLKCSEVCFEVQRSAYFAALGLHCRWTWESVRFWTNCNQIA